MQTKNAAATIPNRLGKYSVTGFKNPRDIEVSGARCVVINPLTVSLFVHAYWM